MDRPRILVVDDDPDHRLVLATMLARNGYAVVEAATAEEGLERYRAGAFDILLLDIMLPGIDGMELLRRMRTVKPQDDAPVVFVSALHDRATIRQGLELGAIEYLTKPVDYDELQIRLGTLTRLRTLQQALREEGQRLAQQRTLTELMVTLAHHVNNAAYAVMMRCDAVKVDDAAAVREFRDVVRAQTQRIVNVIRSLQQIASRQAAAETTAYSAEQAMIDLKKLLEEFEPH